MNSINILLILFFVTFFVVKGQQDDWNGDTLLCTPETSQGQVPPGVTFPRFPTKAQFALESVEITSTYGSTEHLIKQMMLEYFYDYEANSLVVLKNANGIIDVEFYYYNILKKSTYYRGSYCNVTNIEKYKITDGSSAIDIGNIPHLRPMEQFLLFRSDSPIEGNVYPKYLRGDTVRGISVDVWESCIVDKATHRTIRREWSFAKPTYPMPTGILTTAVPIQALINTTLMLNGTIRLIEVDEIYNVLSYKPGIIERADAFHPPPGVFCAGLGEENLFALNDKGIRWPERGFSVRVDATTSKQTQWQTFHLRMERTFRERKLIRYDYKPLGDDFESVIIDYGSRVKYIIDRQLGSCRIDNSTQFRPLDILRYPIEFFIKYEHLLIDEEPTEKRFQYNGLRPCRGNTIECIIVTTSVDNFPEIPATEESWTVTNVEWAWSQRNPGAIPDCQRPPCVAQFDYPVHLYLKLYRIAPEHEIGYETEDVQFDFYEFNHDVHEEEFDPSICYRSNDLDYLHLAFNLKVTKKDNIIENTQLDRHDLIEHVRRTAASVMDVRQLRISRLEVDHDEQDDIAYVMFTLLGKTPFNDNSNEPSVEDARAKLQTAIDKNEFKFNVTILNVSRHELTATPKSLSDSKQYISSHSRLNRKKTVKYTSGSIAGGILGGILVGMVLGIILLVGIKHLKHESLPATARLTSAITSPFHSRTHASTPSSTTNAKSETTA